MYGKKETMRDVKNEQKIPVKVVGINLKMLMTICGSQFYLSTWLGYSPQLLKQ